jgi:mono/diheme cytochrome c family protein
MRVALGDSPEARLAAMGTFTGEDAPTSISIPINGAVPYTYGNTDAERVRASQEILSSPIPITAEGLKQGQNLYGIYCGICHGEKGDGLGYLVREGDPARGISAGVYPAAPANFLKDNFIDSTAGMYYHSIMYGKNVMGSYADKLSYTERWKVIQYIFSLQAKARGVVYNENENTFNADVPGGPHLKKMQEETAQSARPAAENHEESTDHIREEEQGGH